MPFARLSILTLRTPWGTLRGHVVCAVVCALALALLGCVSRPSDERLIRLARDFARSYRVNIDDYTASVDRTEPGMSAVSFRPRSSTPRPGDDFVVFIQDRNLECCLFPGR